jgi:hypothetical protein
MSTIWQCRARRRSSQRRTRCAPEDGAQRRPHTPTHGVVSIGRGEVVEHALCVARPPGTPSRVVGSQGLAATGTGAGTRRWRARPPLWAHGFAGPFRARVAAGRGACRGGARRYRRDPFRSQSSGAS